MKSVLKLDLHKVLPGQQVVEVWHGEQFIGTVTGADGPGVRIVSKHFMETAFCLGGAVEPHVMEVRIKP